MKPIGKKMLTGSIAAALLFGGAGLLHNNQANAAATGAPTTQQSKASSNHHEIQGRGFDMVQQAAAILGLDPSAIKDQLKQGKTLAQAAQDKGISEDVLLQKLTDAENQAIDAAVTAGKITQAQADKQKSGLADRLKKVVEHTGFGKEEKREKGQRGGREHESNFVKEAAAILGLDQSAIKDQLKQGKTLVQVAQDKGMSEEILLQKLTDAKNQSIDAAVAAGKMTQAQADKLKSGLADRLKQEIEDTDTGRNDDHEKGHFGPFAQPAALSQILGLTQQELTAGLKAGQSLTEIAQAKGISKDQLISKIKDSMTDKITQFVEKKHDMKHSTPAPAPAASAGTSTN